MSLTIKKMQIKSTKYQFAPVMMAITKKTKDNKFGKDGDKMKETLYTVGGNVNWYFFYEKQYRNLQQSKVELPYDPEIPLLGIY